MNQLQFEKSPYLLSHADNPVDWLPWGQAAFDRARAEDYAYLAWGSLELYGATFRPGYLCRACELADGLLERFFDRERDGVYPYGADGEQLITRNKETYDGGAAHRLGTWENDTSSAPVRAPGHLPLKGKALGRRRRRI